MRSACPRRGSEPAPEGLRHSYADVIIDISVNLSLMWFNKEADIQKDHKRMGVLDQGPFVCVSVGGVRNVKGRDGMLPDLTVTELIILRGGACSRGTHEQLQLPSLRWRTSTDPRWSWFHPPSPYFAFSGLKPANVLNSDKLKVRASESSLCLRFRSAPVN